MLNQKELFYLAIRYIFHKNICIFSRLKIVKIMNNNNIYVKKQT